MTQYRAPEDVTEEVPTTPTITETPERFAMGVKPPPVTFDMIEDLGRVCDSIKAMAELGASQCDEETLRRLARLVMVEREMRQIVHVAALHKRTKDDALFPPYRDFDDTKLIVQDLQAVWDGKKWTGDGACTFNKWHLTPLAPVAGRELYLMNAYQKALIMHTSMSEYRVGERNVSGRNFIDSSQYFQFHDLKVGDYITGELYVEIC